MFSALIHRLSAVERREHPHLMWAFGAVRLFSAHLVHLGSMDVEQLKALGLEQMLTTSELAEYIGVNVQALYDLRADGRGPAAIRVGKELRFRVSAVRSWLDGLERSGANRINGGDR